MYTYATRDAGKPLSDEFSLAECGELATLEVELRLLGGKVSVLINVTIMMPMWPIRSITTPSPLV